MKEASGVREGQSNKDAKNGRRQMDPHVIGGVFKLNKSVVEDQSRCDAGEEAASKLDLQNVNAVTATRWWSEGATSC